MHLLNFQCGIYLLESWELRSFDHKCWWSIYVLELSCWIWKNLRIWFPTRCENSVPFVQFQSHHETLYFLVQLCPELPMHWITILSTCYPHALTYAHTLLPVFLNFHTLLQSSGVFAQLKLYGTICLSLCFPCLNCEPRPHYLHSSSTFFPWSLNLTWGWLIYFILLTGSPNFSNRFVWDSNWVALEG